MTDKPEVSVGDIIQVSPTAKVREVARGCLAVVDEVRTWGVVAWLHGLGSPHIVCLKPTGQAFLRLSFEDFEATGGKILWVPQCDDDEAGEPG